jgi:hypothetical protein
MSLRYDQWASGPGPTVAAETFYDGMLRWGMFGQGVITGAVIDGSTRDAGNTPTTALRAGLLLGVIISSGKLRDFGDANTDGSDVAAAVLLESVRITDFDANNVDKFWGVLVGGPVQASRIYGLTEQARVQMSDRFIFDDRGFNQMVGGWNRTTAKTANYTVVNGTDNNTIFTTTGAAGEVDFTLPATIMKGQRWRFVNTVGQTMKIIAPAGKLVCFNNAAATSITFSTAGSLIGASVEIIVDDTGAKYIAQSFTETANAETIA